MMIGSVRRVTLASLLGTAAFAGAASPAWASGFALREESAEGLGNAYAGQTAKAYNSSTVYYNPAGMVLLKDDEVASTVSWIAPQAKFHGSNSSPFGGDVAGTTGQDAIKDAAIGTVFAAYRLNPDWSLGLSIAVPYGMRSEYKEDWVGRYQALTSDVTDIEFSPVVAYRINDQWSVGGGPRIDYLSAKLTQAINFQAVGAGAGLPSAVYGAYGDGLARVRGDDVGVGYVLSTLYQYDPATRVGLTYRSRINHELSGDAYYQNTPSLLSSAFVNQDAKAKITLPDSLTMGLYRDLSPRWAVMSDVSWTHWSLFKTLNVTGDNGAAISSTNEKWSDSWFVSLGTNYKPADDWVLHAGVAYDQSPVKDDNRTARIPDTDRYWLSFGASYTLTPRSDVHLGYTHLFADKGTINETANSAAGTLTGSYDNSADVVSASLTLKF